MKITAARGDSLVSSETTLTLDFLLQSLVSGGHNATITVPEAIKNCFPAYTVNQCTQSGTDIACGISGNDLIIELDLDTAASNTVRIILTTFKNPPSEYTWTLTGTVAGYSGSRSFAIKANSGDLTGPTGSKVDVTAAANSEVGMLTDLTIQFYPTHQIYPNGKILVTFPDSSYLQGSCTAIANSVHTHTYIYIYIYIVGDYKPRLHSKWEHDHLGEGGDINDREYRACERDLKQHQESDAYE